MTVFEQLYEQFRRPLDDGSCVKPSVTFVGVGTDGACEPSSSGPLDERECKGRALLPRVSVAILFSRSSSGPADIAGAAARSPRPAPLDTPRVSTADRGQLSRDAAVGRRSLILDD